MKFDRHIGSTAAEVPVKFRSDRTILNIQISRLRDFTRSYGKTSFRILRRGPGIILGMGSAKEKRRYIVTPPSIGWAHTQNDPWYRRQSDAHRHSEEMATFNIREDKTFAYHVLKILYALSFENQRQRNVTNIICFGQMLALGAQARISNNRMYWPCQRPGYWLWRHHYMGW